MSDDENWSVVMATRLSWANRVRMLFKPWIHVHIHGQGAARLTSTVVTFASAQEALRPPC